MFTTTASDTTFLVPWLFRSRTRPGGVDRTVRGWLGRGGSWDPFLSAEWGTPPSRAPWRLLPQSGVRLVVGEGDAVESLLFEAGQRALEVEMGDVLMEWTGSGGETFRVVNAALYLSERRIAGLLLDATRVYAADATPPGDWAFLTSGDSVQVLLESPALAEPGAPGAYRAWARVDFRDLQWPDVTVTWDEARAFEPARRDIPVAWGIASPDRLSGRLEVVSTHLQAGEGPGPLLPVDALLEVSGTVTIQGLRYPVRGLVRHTRP